MLCAKCNNDNPADAMFSMKCGIKVENRIAKNRSHDLAVDDSATSFKICSTKN
jgi:hypothetical protein